jgi:hypothetical protein
MLWLFRTADVCGLNVEGGGREQKLKAVAGTCKMQSRQIENDGKSNSCDRRHQGEPASATGSVGKIFRSSSQSRRNKEVGGLCCWSSYLDSCKLQSGSKFVMDV